MEDSGACRALQCRRSNPNDLAQKRHTQSHKEQESRITQKQEEQELNHKVQESRIVQKQEENQKEKEARKES